MKSMILMLMLLTGCASERPAYKLYPGAVAPDQELAVIHLDPRTALSIDGINVAAEEYRVVKLRPGPYRLAGGRFYSITQRSDFSGEPYDTLLRCRSPVNEVALNGDGRYQVRRVSGGESVGLRVMDIEAGREIWRCFVD